MPVAREPSAIPTLRRRIPVSPRRRSSPSTSATATMPDGRGAGSSSTAGGPAAVSRAPGWGPGPTPPHRMVPGTDLDPARSQPSDARPGQTPELGPPPLAEHEHLEPAVAGDERVRRAPREVHERVAGAHGVRRPVLPRQPVAGEHEAELLLEVVGVRRRALRAGRDADAAQADLDRSRGVAEVGPAGLHGTLVDRPLRHIVPMAEHPAAMVLARRKEPPARARIRRCHA